MNRQRLAATAAGLLGLLGIAAVTVVAVRDWTHGDEPTIVLFLLLGIFLSIFGISLAAFAAIKLRYRLAWVIAVINGLILAVSIRSFGLL